MWNYNPYYEDYLIHYGILGMKWGIRRYQNYDGSLTSAGRKRIDKIYKKNIDLLNTNKEKQQYNDTDRIVKKGTSQYRVAPIDEPLDNKRKYLSDEHDFLYSYSNMFDLLPVEESKRKLIGAIRYTAIKDIKVKNSKEVFDYVVEKYGKEKTNVIKDLNYISEKGLDSYNLHKIKMSNKDREIIKNVRNNGRIQPLFEKNIDSILEHYKKQGYQAIEDIVDSKHDDQHSALILSTPVKYLKQEAADIDMFNVLE